MSDTFGFSSEREFSSINLLLPGIREGGESSTFSEESITEASKWPIVINDTTAPS